MAKNCLFSCCFLSYSCFIFKRFCSQTQAFFSTLYQSSDYSRFYSNYLICFSASCFDRYLFTYDNYIFFRIYSNYGSLALTFYISCILCLFSIFSLRNCSLKSLSLISNATDIFSQLEIVQFLKKVIIFQQSEQQLDNKIGIRVAIWRMEKNESMIIHVLKKDKNISQLTYDTNQINEMKPENLQNLGTEKEIKDKFCGICCKLCQIDEIVSVGNCTHVFCISCTRSYIQQKMVSYRVLKCCGQDCQEELVINSKLKNKRKIKYYFQKISTKEQKKIKQYIKQLKKLKEKRKVCIKCKQGDRSGEGQKCPECKQSQIEIPQNFKKCPNCKKIIQKMKGCDHVKCLCGHQFCFLCFQQWNRSHICEFKVPTRTGITRILCFLIKMLVYFILVLVLGLFVLTFSLFICLVSSFLFGFFIEIKIMERLSKNKSMAEIIKFIVLMLSFILLPIIVIFSCIPGFFLPIVNICYKQKVLLDPSLISQVTLNAFSCLVVVRLL